MKSGTLLLVLLFSINVNSFAQANLSGTYTVTGYFFHPTASRAINLTKTITQVSANTYQVDLGDLGGSGYSFQFTLDNSNNLINWVAAGNTPPDTQSGFMTADDPGNLYPDSAGYPGTAPWLQSTYNNTYDPATHTLHLHYGYAAGALGQNGFSRQVYEAWVLSSAPPLDVISFKPATGTYFTKITIKGKNFNNIFLANGISFGGRVSDSAVVLSDTVINAWVGYGTSGNVRVESNTNGSDTLPGFTYNPVPPVTNPKWDYIGPVGFSQNRAYFVNAACGVNNIPVVAFVDSLSGKAIAMQFISNKWQKLSAAISKGKTTNLQLVLDNTDKPVVAYIDSAKNGFITVRKYDGSSWSNIGSTGFTSSFGFNGNAFSLAIDNANTPYILSMTQTYHAITVFKFNGTNWDTVGASYFARSANGFANIAIDKISNTPYVVFDDFDSSIKATVMKFNGHTWVLVGAKGFTTGTFGVYYSDIEIDGLGKPVVSFQDDNSFERQSAYKYSSNAWSPVGYPYFSKAHTYYSSLAISKKNQPFVLFLDVSYNNRGTVRSFANKRWDTVGARGFIPANFYMRHSLVMDTSDLPVVAFSDNLHGGKVSVMRFNPVALADLSAKENSKEKSPAFNEHINIFPNPASAKSTLIFTAGKPGKYAVEVTNLEGRRMKYIEITAAAGENKVEIDLSNFAEGVYLVSITGNGSYTHGLKISRQ